MSSSFYKLDPKIQEAVWDLGWEELRPLQVQSIDAILGDGSHLILSAATASGKTEAAFLPILSRIAGGPRESIQALYISPLIALINDQFRRLEQLCEKAGIAVHRRHGGVAQSERHRMMKRPSGVLLITPESLEALFIRRGCELARIFSGLEFVVIDELHSFLDQVRGIHLASLLKRLQAASGATPRLIGLSATLGNFAAAKEFLARETPESVRVISDPSQSKDLRISLKSFIEKKREPGAEHRAEPLDPVAEEIALRCRHGCHLVFCNARAQAEVLADQLHAIAAQVGWEVDPFLLHHGSISKDLRHEAEQSLKGSKPVTVICTSTLELGIDIGSVQTVCQVGPPWSVGSLMQRVGRSGRKEDQGQFLYLFTIDRELSAQSPVSDRLYPELIRGIALIELLIARWVESSSSGGCQRFNYSTFIHQVLSVLRQTGGLKVPALYEQLCERGAFGKINRKDFILLLRNLREKALIEQMASGEIILAPAGEQIVEDRNFYAAFARAIEYCVESAGDPIGVLPSDSIPQPEEAILLAGRRWQVQAVCHGQTGSVSFPQKARTRPDLVDRPARLIRGSCTKCARFWLERPHTPTSILKPRKCSRPRARFLRARAWPYKTSSRLGTRRSGFPGQAQGLMRP